MEPAMSEAPTHGGPALAPAPPTEAPSHTPARPAPVADRIAAIDVARGIALFGIFTVNIQIFFEPLGAFMQFFPTASGSVTDQTIHYLRKIFTEGRTYPLFSMLFGMGLVLQTSASAPPDGQPSPLIFGALRARPHRLCHALFLWYGDILFIHACVGLILLFASRLDSAGS